MTLKILNHRLLQKNSILISIPIEGHVLFQAVFSSLIKESTTIREILMPAWGNHPRGGRKVRWPLDAEDDDLLWENGNNMDLS